MARLGKIIYKNKRLSVIEVNSEITPFAYFNKVYVPASSFEKQHIDTIILHEKTHLEQYHFADILLVQILTILQWFNPVAWMFEKTLKEVHEYLADEAVLKQGQDQGIYQAQLINQVLGGPVFSITNSFNNSLIKKRIVMMTKMKTSRMAQLKVLFFVPVLVILLVAFANPKSPELLNNTNNIKDTTKSIQANNQEKKYTTQVEQMPEFPGGSEKLFEYLKKNVKYPLEAKKNNITGKVFVQFVVVSDGTITDIKIAKSVDSIIDNEAIRVIKNMPNWRPGKNNGVPVNTQMTIPINFALK
jgi:TonB family protein